MKILLSPSEAKTIVNNKIHIRGKSSESISQNFNQNNFDFLDILLCRGEILHENLRKYIEILRGQDEEICKLFGVKNLASSKILDELTLCTQITQNSFLSTKIPAIELYAGVAYKALLFANLPPSAQDYILDNVFIFSNLFGMVRASDILPFYKYNQNFKNKDFSIMKLYKKLGHKIDKILLEEKILDLRSEIYIKAYKVKSSHTKVEFIKNNKKISHYAKHYRGLYLRAISLSPNTPLESLKVEGLTLVNTISYQNNTTLVYKIN